MNKCKCWEEKQQIVGWCGNEPTFHTIQICNGTKEREVCSCNGNESKCNFYPERKNKKTGKWEVQYVCSVCGGNTKEQMAECPFCHSKMDVKLKRM